MSKPLPEKKIVMRCDFIGCTEMAQWYRRYKGELLRLCTKHEAYMVRAHQGFSVESKDLTPDDRRYLIEKDEDDEL